MLPCMRGRYYVLRHSLPVLKEVGLICFRGGWCAMDRDGDLGAAVDGHAWMQAPHGLQPPHGVQPQGSGLTVAIARLWLHVAQASVCLPVSAILLVYPPGPLMHSACCVSVSMEPYDQEVDAPTV